MSDDEEESLNFYGKPLEQYDEDAFPKKRPISVEEQIATDTQGRRRFHGAFTGGFSAGFFNTVGSVEGWKPSEFKSSRSEKTEGKQQKPEDYMDDEDMGEFGIAPQVVKATKDFNTSKKRKKKVFSDGPIPGEPVLHVLIENSTETIGYLLLRNIGYKQVKEQEEQQKVYGCTMPRAYEMRPSIRNTTYELPEIYAASLKTTKNNTFGFGYSGLDRGNVNLFSASKSFIVKDKNNKNMTIGGQAFGVGAFEEEDDDIYSKEDISSYDFELTSEKQKEKLKAHGKLLHDIFVLSKTNLAMNEVFPPPKIPQSFTGKHKVRKSRFAPIAEPEPPPPVRRSEVDARTRALALGEPVPEPARREEVKVEEIKKEEVKKEVQNPPWLIFDKFVSAGESAEHTDPMEPTTRSESLHGTQEMRDAAKMKMFGRLTRITQDWLPHPVICKRFNVPEPSYWEQVELKPQAKKRNLIFQNEMDVDETGRVQTSGLQSNSNFSVPHREPEKVAEEPKPVEVEEIKPEKPHEEVILVVDITEKIDVSKNIDLFKAVFMSDDEDEETPDATASQEAVEAEEVKETEESKMEEMKEAVLAKDMFLPKIKPFKEGILSDIPFIKFTKPPTAAAVTPAIEEAPKLPENLYGPKLPDKIVNKVEKLTEAQSDDVWVERTEEKPRKKHKKEKHKKHKHKHKR